MADAANGVGGVVVTLVTGDTIVWQDSDDGQPSYHAQAAVREDGETVGFHAEGDQQDFYVYPSDAMPYVMAGVLDRELFNIPGLIEQGLDDASSEALPVVVTYDGGRRSTAQLDRDADALPATSDPIALATLQGAGVGIDRDHAGDFWAAVTDQQAGNHPQAASLDRGIASIQLDAMLEISLDESVPQIGAPEAWDAGYTGEGVTVAVLDTGIDASHPDLDGQVVATANFTDEPDVTDGHGHGTHVASTIAGTGTAADGLYTGVAPDAALMIGKVCDSEGRCPTSAVAAGMDWAAINGADIVNMSLGGDATDGTDELSQAVNGLSSVFGTLFVVAAGNDGPGVNTVASPGAADLALTVGAVDKNDQLADFSSRGPRVGDHMVKPEVTAPGVDITAARAAGTGMGDPAGDAYTAASGTSMATPHVTGAAALLAQARPDLTAGELKDTMASTTVDGGYLWLEQGTGRVEIPAAIEQGVHGSASVNFGDLGDTTTPIDQGVVYTNHTDTTVTLQLAAVVTDRNAQPVDGFSLSADTVTIPAEGTAGITATVDPQATDQGVFGGTITATVDGTTVRTSIGYGKTETHQVTINILDSTGQQGAASTKPWSIELVHDTYDPASPIGNPNYGFNPVDGVATGRIPVGTYTVMTTVYEGDFSQGWDGLQRASLVAAVEVDIDADTTITLDARDAVSTEVIIPEETETRFHVVHLTREYVNTPGQSYTIAAGNNGEPVYVSPTPVGELGFFGLLDIWTLAEPQPLAEPETCFPTGCVSRAPGYSYHLPFVYPNGIPDNLTRTITHQDLVRIPTRLHAEQSDSIYELLWLGRPPYPSVILSPLWWTEPGQMDVYLLADDRITWARYSGVHVGADLFSQWSSDRYSDELAGTTNPVERWLEAPWRAGAPDVPNMDYIGEHPYALPPATALARGGPDGNEFMPGLYYMDNSAGNWMSPSDRPDLPAQWRMWNVDTGIELAADWKYDKIPVFHLSEQPETYRLEAVATPYPAYDVFRTAPQTTTVWEFTSAPSDGKVPDGYTCTIWWQLERGDVCQFQPTVQLRYELNLDLTNHAPAGRAHVATIHAASHSQAPAAAPVTEMTVETSFDGGETWSDARTAGTITDGVAKVILKHPPLHRTDGCVTLRVNATDADGNTVEQTVECAYMLK